MASSAATARHQGSRVSGTCLLVTSVLLLVTVQGLGVDAMVKQSEASPAQRSKRNAGDQQQSGNDLTDIIRQLSVNDNSLSNVDLLQYTPSTPSPENVNCYVEVPVTRRVGGRCVSLGSNAMGCQAGVYLALSSQCQAQATRSTSTQTSAQSTRSNLRQASRRRAGRALGRGRRPLSRRRSQPRQ